MAQLDLPPGLLPSLKDRLFDPDAMGTRAMPGYNLEQVLDSVRDDLEDLLNTRRSFQLSETKYPELALSIATYGLPDLTSLDTASLAKRDAIGRILEKVIALYEPRLRNIRAVMEPPRPNELSATFRIDADLRSRPGPPGGVPDRRAVDHRARRHSRRHGMT